MKVLISAYACEPGRGSEPGAGWVWARAAALDHDVWVLTRENNRGAIEAALEEEPELRMHPVYLDLPKWARWWKRGGRGVHLYYFLWQFLAYRAGKRLHAQHRFDAGHHLTFAVDWMPAGIAWVPGLPFVWGPVGGATGTPWVLWRWLGWRGVIEEAIRELTTRPLRRLFGDPTAKRADLVVAQNHDVAKRFSYVKRLVVEPNAAVDLDVEMPERNREGGPRQAVFVGRLIPWKGLRLAIAALAEPEAAGWYLDVYGEGREEEPARQLAAKLGVAGRVRFRGNRPRGEVLSAMASADVLLHLSMHDAAGWAVAEAVSLGLPVVCLDRGGPPILAGAAKIAVGAARTTPAELARGLEMTTSGRPTGRWSGRRLPQLLANWYAAAAGPAEPAQKVDPRVDEAVL